MPTESQIEFLPVADQLDLIHKGVADLSGLRFGFTVAEARQSGFWLDPDRLRRTIDLVAAAL